MFQAIRHWESPTVMTHSSLLINGTIVPMLDAGIKCCGIGVALLYVEACSTIATG